MRAVRVLAAIALLGALAGCSSSSASAPKGSRQLSIAGHAAVEMGAGRATVVVMIHGLTTHKDSWYPLMPALTTAGAWTIAYDYDSSKSADVAAIVDYAKAHGATRVVLVGSSLGAQHALESAGSLHAAAVVTFSSEVDRTIKEPLLAIASKGDGDTAAIAGRNVDQAATHGGHDSQVVVVDGSTHGIDLVHPHPEVITTVVSWLGKTAGAG